jgi:hypothetical protein
LWEVWRVQQKHTRGQVEQRKDKMNQTFPLQAVPIKLFSETRRTDGSPSPTPRSSSPPDDVDTANHAMVMLGGWHDKQGNPYIMLLNSWKSMPLVLVSPGYLVACGAKIYFLNEKLTDDTKVARKEGLFGMCGYPDGGAGYL